MPLKLDLRLKLLEVRKKTKLRHLTPNFSPAFTLIEILVVLSIIAVLAGGLLYSTNNAREKGKDARRKEDLKAVASALVAYYADYRQYPTASPPPPPLDYASSPYATDWIPSLVPNYIQKLPQDPTRNETGSIITQLASTVKKILNNPLNQNTSTKGQVAGTTAPQTYYVTSGKDDGKTRNRLNLVPGDTTIIYESDIPDNPQGTRYECPIIRENYFRFSGIDIPQGAHIDTAKLVITPSTWGGSTPQNQADIPNFRSVLRAENSDDATQITDDGDYPYGLPTNFNSRVANNLIPGVSVDWNAIGRWNPTPTGPNPANESPDISSLIQPLVSRGTWSASTSSLKHISIFWLDNGTTGCSGSVGQGRAGVSYEGMQQGMGTQPRLVISYTVSAPVPDLKGRPDGTTPPDGNGPIVVTSGAKARLSWTVGNSVNSSCTLKDQADPATTLSTALSMGDSPGYLTGIISSNKIYKLECTSPGGTASDTISVNVAASATVCLPATQTVALPSANASFTASGGNGTYSWSAPSGSPSGSISGSSFSTTYSSSSGSPYTVTVTSGAQNATCTVTVTAAPIIIPDDLPGGSGDAEACKNRSFILCYRVSTDRRNFILWTQLENANDPEIYTKSSATCNNIADPTIIPPAALAAPAGSYLNYCIRSPR